MALAAGARLGPYEILSALGAGGMGEVYRARDTKLNRDVAIKILPDLFVADADRIARFQREAQVLASLNHPNIAAIYGLEESNGIRALVLELVEGPTLADRLSQGALSLNETLTIARQIADALEAAHEKGIVHRDLKPANVALTANDQVKVLDFGLAKLARGGAGGASAPGELAAMTNSPTLTAMMTRAGVILGTAAYMSPEQAKGREADKRSDVWAFGCVLFEMLTRKRAFEGDDVSDTLAAVLRGEPDWKALPQGVPAHVRMIVARCLEKNRQTRFADISTAKFLLNEGSDLATGPGLRLGRSMVHTGGWIAAAATVSGIIVGAATWAVMRVPAESPRPVRFAIVPPAAEPLMVGPDRDIAISPDGTQIVYRAGQGEAHLAVRTVDQLEARSLAGTTGNVRGPFMSPDGQWVGFFSNRNELQKVSITGGPPITLCRVAGGSRGASWGPDDTIVFATSDSTTGLLSVPANGGKPNVLTTPDRGRGEIDHLFPAILPGGRAVLFTITSSQPEDAQIAVLDLKTGQRKTLIRGGSHAEYVATGHLVYAAAGTLRAVRFDLGRLEVLSDPVQVVEHVMTTGTGAANFAISERGTLVYVPGGVSTGAQSLAWINRQGAEEPIKAPPRSYVIPRLSPDGTRIALDVRDQETDIWIWDLAHETLTRLTFDPGFDAWPIWTPDGRRIVFTSGRGGTPNLWWRLADGTGADERLTTSPHDQRPASFSPDGKVLVVREIMPKTGVDLMLLGTDGLSTGLRTGKPQTEPLIATTFNEDGGEISPDGQWLAYHSNETGQDQVYVRPFPKVESGKWQVSTGGGAWPAWARNGRELFYVTASGLMAVSVQITPDFRTTTPTKVVGGQFFRSQAGRSYDVSADGQRFLMIKNAAAIGQAADATAPRLIVVEHWSEELKARVPTK
jgi:serine/threonine-protein kinase